MTPGSTNYIGNSTCNVTRLYCPPSTEKAKQRALTYVEKWEQRQFSLQLFETQVHPHIDSLRDDTKPLSLSFVEFVVMEVVLSNSYVYDLCHQTCSDNLNYRRKLLWLRMKCKRTCGGATPRWHALHYRESITKRLHQAGFHPKPPECFRKYLGMKQSPVTTFPVPPDLDDFPDIREAHVKFFARLFPNDPEMYDDHKEIDARARVFPPAEKLVYEEAHSKLHVSRAHCLDREWYEEWDKDVKEGKWKLLNGCKDVMEIFERRGPSDVGVRSY